MNIKNSYTSRNQICTLLIVAVVWNQIVYLGGNLIARSLPHHNLEICLDQLVPFLPWTVFIYFGCYFYWAVNYTLCARQKKALAYRFFCADFLAKTVCLVLFILLPTTNIRPSVNGQTIWDNLMRLLYQIDAPSNLFPSIHCLVSWLCYIGIRGKQNIPKWYRCSSCLMAAAVFLSTLTTKQHVFWDVAGGVLLAEVSYWLAGRPPVLKVYTYLMEGLMSIRKFPCRESIQRDK